MEHIASVDTFAAKSVDEKLDILYGFITSEAANNTRRHQELRSDFQQMQKEVKKLEERMDEYATHQDGM